MEMDKNKKSNMTAEEMISILSSIPKNAKIICGNSPFTMFVTSERDNGIFFDIMFIGISGESPVFVPINKLIGR